METPDGRTIKVARASIEQVNMRRSEANVLADPIEEIEYGDELDNNKYESQQPMDKEIVGD
ncbi:hypothetical protein, partial [Lysinibacillus fusiformis]|uniref:hypothetical protein n=1 Tax=Lysinibacillus fusiformis TaxID=28031 RepID=UPI0020BD65D8